MLDVQTGLAIHEFPYPAAGLRDLDVSRDGRLVAVSAGDQTVRVFRLPPSPQPAKAEPKAGPDASK